LNATGVELPDFEAQVETPPPAQEEPVVAEEDADLPDTPAAENFKKLRTVVKETRAAKKQLEEELGNTRSKLEKYEKGEVVPDIIQAKDQRIQQLEQYEKVVNLKMSPEYQTKFVEPAVNLKQELHQIGQDYGVPPHIMEQAVGITNRRDLNNFLSRHFDDVGGLEVKRVIGELQTLGESAVEAEQNAGESLQRLRTEFHEKELQRAQERSKVFEVTAKDAWNSALKKTAEEGVFKELIVHPTDSEYNKKVVEPIQSRAATQYGALVKKLAENGLKQLPPELASGLARMVLLSIGGALTFDTKVKAEQTASQLMQHASRVTPYLRPSIGGQNGSAHTNKASQSRGPTTPQEAARLATQALKR
jgi:transcriptional regulator with XRE-family HTH domain